MTAVDLYAQTEFDVGPEQLGFEDAATLRAWEYGGGDAARLFDLHDWFERFANPKEPK